MNEDERAGTVIVDMSDIDKVTQRKKPPSKGDLGQPTDALQPRTQESLRSRA